ncbi:hypothetical protein [Pseudomonas sp.]|jgi:hypothetical protein|uniref:hypothetical protein n=1 Tax=Pseudomonas sp. TaxID=306 RepID=UPI002ED98C3C
MADSTKGGIWARAKKLAQTLADGDRNIAEVDVADTMQGYDTVSVSMLLGSGSRSARSRAQIYEQFAHMMSDPIIATALRLHVTQALGGHETNGDTIFIEMKAGCEPLKKYVDDIRLNCAPLFNREAHGIAFNAAGFGDAYARTYLKKGEGLLDLINNEMLYPPLVQPYEKGNRTVGYVVSSGEKQQQRLTPTQMARMKMPRLLWVPQIRAVDKAYRYNLAEDDLEKLTPMPAMIGGGFLYEAEEPHGRLRSSLLGLVGQRILGTIDENLITVETEGMSLQQRKSFMASINRMLTKSKEVAEKAVRDNQPVTTRQYHVLPVSGQKAVTSVSSFQGATATNGMTIDDVMLQARLLAGALGTDLSMLGFADQLSGGLGDGGFFRVSAQSAERSRMIRTALTAFFHYLIDLHTWAKYGFVWEDGDRPYEINYFGSISALESENAETRERKINGASTLMTVLEAMRNSGLPEEVCMQLLTKDMGYDEDEARIIAKGIRNAKPPDAGGFGGDGGGFDAPPGRTTSGNPEVDEEEEMEDA